MQTISFIDSVLCDNFLDDDGGVCSVELASLEDKLLPLLVLFVLASCISGGVGGCRDMISLESGSPWTAGLAAFDVLLLFVCVRS